MVGPPEDNFRKVWMTIVSYYRRESVRTQFTGMSLSSFTNPDRPKADYPSLKGKGAEIKDVVRGVFLAWQAYGNYQYARVEELLNAQLEMIAILTNNAGLLFLPPEESAQFVDANDRVLKLFSELARQADTDELLLWKLVPKHHWQFHLAQKARWLNPRVSACFLDEDFVGQLKQIVATCTPGTPMEEVPLSVQAKVSWSMHFEQV